MCAEQCHCQGVVTLMQAPGRVCVHSVCARAHAHVHVRAHVCAHDACASAPDESRAGDAQSQASKEGQATTPEEQSCDAGKLDISGPSFELHLIQQGVAWVIVLACVYAVCVCLPV